MEIKRHGSLLQVAIDDLSGLPIIIHHAQSAISIIVQMVDILFWVIAFEEVLGSIEFRMGNLARGERFGASARF